MKYFVLAVLLLTAGSAQSQGIETVVQRKSGGVGNDFTISPDGMLLAKITEDVGSHEIEIWNTKTGHLLQTITTETSAINFINHIRFWKNGKIIIAGNLGGKYALYDVASGKKIKDLPLLSWVDAVFAINETSGIMAYVHSASLNRSSIVLYDLYSDAAYDSMQLKFSGISAIEFSNDGQILCIGSDDGRVHFFDIAKNEVKTFDNIHDKPINYLQWTKDNYLLVSDDQKFTFWNLGTEKIINGDSLHKSRIVAIPSEDAFYVINESDIVRMNGLRIVQRSYGVDPDNIKEVSVDDQGKRMYLQTDNFMKVWDLENITQIINKSKKSVDLENSNASLLVPSDRSFIWADNNIVNIQPLDTSIKVMKFTVGKHQIKSILASGINNITFSTQKTIAGFNKGNIKEVNTSSPQKLLFHISDNEVASVDSTLNLTNLATGKKRSLNIKGKFTCGSITASKDKFAIGGSHLYIINAATLNAIELYDADKEDVITDYYGSISRLRFPGNYDQLCLSPNGKKLFAKNLLGQIKVWDLQTRRIDTILNFNASSIYFSFSTNKLFIVRRNELIWLDPVTYSNLASIVFLEKGDHIVTLPDNKYKSSRNGSKAVAFRKGLQTSSFDQYDVIYNRPDIVTETLGSPSGETKDLLKKAVAKRWKRLGIAIEQVNAADVDPPQVTIRKYGALPTVTDKQILKFVIEASDKNNLTKAHVFINGVPLNKKDGIDLQALAGTSEVKSLNLNITAALEPGNNLIEASCVNDKGIESARISFEIFYKDSLQHKPDLYFIGVGADTYVDSSFNLKYPERDVTDVSSLFQNNHDQFGKVKSILFKKNHVTKDEVLKVKAILDSTNINDYVIIHWSGHGVLSKELDYYLATYDMDFKEPSKRGMNYNDLEDLLDNIPARKRLLFIDACHSGEIDKDDDKFVKIIASSADTATAVQTKGLNIRRSKKVSNAEILNELFADVRRQSGANIISAAGGAEFALEGDNWGYGVFTYSLLRGMREHKADLNNDGKIYISELQTYLQQSVLQLTDGRQKPTSRTENLVTDWRIW